MAEGDARYRRQVLAPAGAVDVWLVTQGDRVVQVETNHPCVEPMLRHAFGRHAGVVPLASGAPVGSRWRIRALASTGYEAELAALEKSLDDRDAAGLADYWRGDFQARRMSGRSGYSVHHAAPFEGVTLFDAALRTVTYLFPAGSPVYIPHLEHLVGHVLRLEGWEQGFVDVHAAFVRYRGKGVALIGPRMAGKTSLALHLLSRGGELLGSDMAQVRTGAQGGVEAVSIPHMCRITRETVRDNAWLAAAASDDWDRNDDYMSGPLFSHGKYELYDPSLDLVFRRPVGIPAMTLDAVLFPRFDVNAPRHEASPTMRTEGGQRLMRSVMTDRPLADWLPFDLSDRQRGEAALERDLASGKVAIPAWDFRFGQEGSLEWPEIDALFDRM